MNHLTPFISASGEFDCLLLPDSSAAIIGWFWSDTSLSIPDTIDGRPVTVIDTQAFRDCDRLSAVFIPEGVTRIEACAFACRSLTRIHIPRSVCKIHPIAFESCKDLCVHVYPGSYAEAYCAEHGIRHVLIPDRR